MDTREDPDFLSDIDDSAADGDMAKLMREVYVVFQSEVSGTECKADAYAGKLMDLMCRLNAEAQGNTPVGDLRNHAGATTKAEGKSCAVREGLLGK